MSLFPTAKENNSDVILNWYACTQEKSHTMFKNYYSKKTLLQGHKKSRKFPTGTETKISCQEAHLHECKHDQY